MRDLPHFTDEAKPAAWPRVTQLGSGLGPALHSAPPPALPRLGREANHAHTHRGRGLRPSRLLCVFPVYTEFSAQHNVKKNSRSSRTLETLPMGLSLEKQQRPQGGKVGDGGGGKARLGFAIKITSGSVSVEWFWKVVVCLMYQVGPSASWPRVGDGLDDV